MDFKKLISKTKKYTALAVAIVALTSWGIFNKPDDNSPDKKAQHGAVGDDLISHIHEIPNWHQLARVIPSWDNLCGVPLNERSFVDGVYLSSNSSMSDKVLYSRQHETNKLFVVFMDPTATIPLKPGDKVLSVSRVDNSFIETTDARSELNISYGKISLAPTPSRPVK